MQGLSPFAHSQKGTYLCDFSPQKLDLSEGGKLVIPIISEKYQSGRKDAFVAVLRSVGGGTAATAGRPGHGQFEERAPPSARFPSRDSPTQRESESLAISQTQALATTGNLPTVTQVLTWHVEPSTSDSLAWTSRLNPKARLTLLNPTAACLERWQTEKAVRRLKAYAL